MLPYQPDYTYLPAGNEKLFTITLLPYAGGKFPTVIIRDPYVECATPELEEDILTRQIKAYRFWLRHGYAIVMQHCRGRGMSTGDFIPSLYEREDGLNLQAWIRKQDFYNGELYLRGTSYTSTVHYATAPFAPDIKGAIFNVQDSEKYNICYRNGCFKKALHGNWYVAHYKRNAGLIKSFTPHAFDLLPLSDFTKTVFGEPAPDFDAMLKAPNPVDSFWNTPYGSCETKGATQKAHFPMLLTTAFNDIYTGGVFDMWNKLPATIKETSALVVSPYNHGDNYNSDETYVFDKGTRIENFGPLYEIEWFDYLRGVRPKSPFKTGEITYYRLFENTWGTDSFVQPDKSRILTLGDAEVSYTYNPYDAPGFKGGLSRTFGGSVFQDKPNFRHDVISIYTEPFTEDTFVKGKITARLRVKTDCEDTCFYIRLSITTERGDFGLRDDICPISFQHADYTPGEMIDMDFSFDEHAFLIRKGTKLRIDLASADNEHYVRHTNQKGLFSEQTTAKVAHNTIDLAHSILSLPIE